MIGIRLADRSFFPVIDETTPAKRRVALIPASDGQTRAEILVFRDGIEEIGRLFLDGLAGAAKSDTDIHLTLEVDATGMVRMTAREVKTGNTDSRVARLDDHHVPPADLVAPTRRQPVIALVLLLLALFLALFFAVRAVLDRRDAAVVGTLAADTTAPDTVEPGAEHKTEPVEPEEPAAEEAPPVADQIAVTEQPPAETSSNDHSQPTAGEAAPKRAVSGVEYLIRSGDTLWDISERYYGSPWFYPDIAGENRITDPDWIYPEDVIVLSER